MSKHTPAPWVANVSHNNGGGWEPMQQYITIEAVSQIVAAYETSACEYPDDATNAANARLIAAAPELLEALRSLLDEADEGWPAPATRAKARAAIYKAEGA